MAEIIKAAIEKRARELAEQDGYVWELTFSPGRRYEPTRGQHFLPDKQRDGYLARARAELSRGSN